ncbi:MAG: hypothetical protein ACLFTT_09330 [Candidatus Hydrogenedentota bacterium]
MKRDTPQHPKCVRLAKALGVRRYVAVGVLQTLWDWAGRFCPDGDVGRHGLDVLADGIDYEGDGETLVSALEESGWIDRDGNRVLLHDWAMHCEDSIHRTLVRRRAYFADGSMPKLTKLGRDEKAQAQAFYGANPPWAAHGVPTGGPREPCLSLSQSHSQHHNPNQDGTAGAEAAPLPGGDGDAAVFAFPLKSGDTWTPPNDLLNELAAAFPAVDLEGELRRARAWLVSNSSKRKTARGMPKFLNGWLARAGKNEKQQTNTEREYDERLSFLDD